MSASGTGLPSLVATTALKVFLVGESMAITFAPVKTIFFSYFPEGCWTFNCAVASLGRPSKWAMPFLVISVNSVPSSSVSVTLAPDRGSLEPLKTVTSVAIVLPKGSWICAPERAKAIPPIIIAKSRMKNGNDGTPRFSMGLTKKS